MPGFTVLHTGYFNDTGTSHGDLISGPNSHTTVLEYKTTAWNNMVGVVAGQIPPNPIPPTLAPGPAPAGRP